MFGSIKKAIAVGAVVAAAAMVPAVASADTWSIDGTNPWAGPATLGGSLKTTLVANGVETECTVSATLDLDNSGVAPWDEAHGVVTSFTMSGCTTTAPGCTVTAVANGLPWTIDTLGTDVTITNVSFTNTYGGGTGCALNGASVSASGTVTGSVVGTDIEFVGATGLSSPFGPLTLDGVVEARDEVTGLPVGMIP